MPSKIASVSLLLSAVLISGCSATPKSITDGRLTVSVPHDWKARKADDGHLVLETDFIHPLFSDDYLARESLTIRSHPTCQTDEQFAQAKANAFHAFFVHRDRTGLWFDVPTKSAPLSCLLENAPSSPSDLMLCLSQDGASAVYLGPSKKRPEAIEILKSLETNLTCSAARK